MGSEANAKKENSIALGNGAKTEATDSVAIGNKASSHQNGVVIGANAKGDGKYNTVIGDSAHGHTEGTTAIGYKAEAGANGGAYAFAAGYEAKALNSSGVAIGKSSKANSKWSVAIGQDATAGEDNDKQNSQVAIGVNTAATGDDAIAIGLRSKAKGEYAISLGADNKNEAKLGTIVGRDNEIKASAAGTVVLGHSVKNVTNANNVILGNESADSAQKNLANALDIVTEGSTLTYKNFAGTAAGVVSVGSKGKERQIHHVSAGEFSVDSTDAVNGSQLYAVAQNAANTAATAVTVLGGDAAVSPDGKLTMSNIGGTNKNTLHDAISNVRGKANDAAAAAALAGQYAANTAGTAATVLGGDAAVSPDGKLTMSNIGGTNENTIHDAISNVRGKANDAAAAAALADQHAGNTAATAVTVLGGDAAVSSDGKLTMSNIGGTNENTLHDAIYSVRTKTDTAVNIIHNKLNNMDNRINKVGAGAAALAALHPMDMDNKFSVAAGFGNYQNANALALGLFYRPAENVMLSAGGSMGNGENLINMGVTFALDKGQGVVSNKVAMARKIDILERENAAKDARIQSLEARLAAIETALKK